MYEPAGAAAWLDTLPAGPSRDRAVGAFAGTIASNYPTDAVRWAESVTNPALRNSQLESVARTWLQVDAAAAKAWITGSNLPDARKARLLGLPAPAAPAKRK